MQRLKRIHVYVRTSICVPHLLIPASVICLCGKLDEVIYEEVVSYENDTDDFQKGMNVQDVARKVEYREVQRIHLNPTETKYGCQVPKGAWHTVEVIEPSVIFEAKDGAYVR